MLEPIDEVARLSRAHLPFAVSWIGPVSHVLLAGLGSRWFTSWFVRGARKRMLVEQDTHWAKRARLSYPFRVMSLWLLAAMGLGAAALAPLWLGPFNQVDTWLHLGAVAAAVFIGWQGPHRVLTASALECDMPLTRWLTDLFIVGGLVYNVAPMTLIVFGLGLGLGRERMAVWVAVALGVLLIYDRGGAMWMMQRLRLARRADTRVEQLVRDASAAMDVPAPPTFLLHWSAANALAFTGARQLGFSQAAIEQLSDEQLKAIAAHELAHLDEPLFMKGVRTLCALSPLPLAATPIFWPTNPTLSALCLGFAASCLLAARLLSQRMEKRADERGAEVNAKAYGSALEALYRANAIPAIQRAGSTHPNLVERSGDEQPWPEDLEAPQYRSALGRLLGTWALFLFVGTLASLAPSALSASDHPTAATIALSTHAGQASDVNCLAEAAAKRGDHGKAAALRDLAQRMLLAAVLADPGATKTPLQPGR